jgi:hypothetical protein
MNEAARLFIALLGAHGEPAAGPTVEAPYDWLIGAWDLEVADHLPDGTIRRAVGECHFVRALEGRAILDLWIIPPAGDRGPETPRPGNRYGITLRYPDTAAGVWRITWINPVTAIEERLVGRYDGNRVVQDGVRADGSLIRWAFSEIASDSFRWTGEASRDGGTTWVLEAEFRGRRRV